MKTPAIILMLIVGLSCTAQNPAIKKALLLLNQESIGYNCFNVRTECHKDLSVDTTFIKHYQKYAFMKNRTDTLTGYNFIQKDSLRHPTFNVIFQPWYHYDGKILYERLNLPSDTIYTQRKIDSEAKAIIQTAIQGQVPSLLNMLQSEHLQALSDTLVNGEPCFQLTLAGEKTPTFLYLSKKTFLPVMTKIIFDCTAPVIEEYYYSNFVTGVKLNGFDFIEKTRHSKTINPISLGDTFPSFRFKYLSGQHIQMTGSKKIKVIYLSMIRCSACLQALPHIKTVYDKLKNNQNVDFFVCYPSDTKEALKKYVVTKKITMPIVYSDTEKENKKLLYQITTIFAVGRPFVLFLNSDNKVVDVITGFSSRFEEEIYTKLAVLTKQ